MSDPAHHAAQRASDKYGIASFKVAELAAREALLPLRELHRRTLDFQDDPGRGSSCLNCKQPWPCDTARLVYPESEL